VRGELLARLGRPDEARTESGRAVARCGNERERALLEGEVAALG
jgi:predicted RNA polymerase sigma factor